MGTECAGETSFRQSELDTWLLNLVQAISSHCRQCVVIQGIHPVFMSILSLPQSQTLYYLNSRDTLYIQTYIHIHSVSYIRMFL